VLKYAWGGQVTAPNATDVMMAPIVIQLDDDNCDGKINENDIPEIVFTSFTGGNYSGNGTLHAISIVNGAVVDKWSKPGEVHPGRQLAGGDIDGLPGNEVVACGTDNKVRAYKGDGTLLWAAAAAVGCYMPSIADLDKDGKPEVIVEGAILNGATGTTKASYSAALRAGLAVSDIDGDGLLDIVTSSQAFHGDGMLFVDTGAPGSYNAIGDFDKDGKPEVVTINSTTHLASFWRYDVNVAAKFTWMRQNVDINGTLVQHCAPAEAGFTAGGGPPTVADFDGDGVPDVALAGGIGYTILNGAKIANPAIANVNTLLWSVPTTDCSSAATGSSVFDFDGDGKAEVIYSDENRLRIYDGLTGVEKFNVCNITGTLIEYPLVADVDNDGHADIIVVSNAYAAPASPNYRCSDGTATSGVRIFGDTKGSWVRTRRIWNQHAYHVTNVNEDGTIPQSEAKNWQQPGLNNFRQNKQPGSEFGAPDAIVSVLPACLGAYGLYATVTNVGEAQLPSGVVVGFYSGTPGSGMKLGEQATTQTLYPAQSETLFLPLPTPPAGVRDGNTPIYVIVDDTTMPHPSWAECRPNNNVTTGSGACSGPR
jgi:FG-GAP-like repeat